MFGIPHILVIGTLISPNIKTEAEKQSSLIILSVFGTSILIILIVTTFFSVRSPALHSNNYYINHSEYINLF